VKLRPLERAAFFKAYSERKLKNIVQGASGAFGNCATRAESFVVKGGTYVYGNYPDIEALFAEQAAEMEPSQARADPAPPAAAGSRQGDLCADLAAGLHLRHRPEGRAIGLRVDQGLPYTAPYEDLTLKGKA
jgi:peptide/nickel transport system substrate-binding protein